MGNLENFTIDQFAGASALVIGSLGGLLMIIWKSRCREIKCKICCGLWSHNCIREIMSDEEEDDKKESKIQKLKKVISRDKLPPRTSEGVPTPAP